jgi:hypothetical protein
MLEMISSVCQPFKAGKGSRSIRADPEKQIKAICHYDTKGIFEYQTSILNSAADGSCED